MGKKFTVAIDVSIFIYANYHIVKKFADKIDYDKFSSKLIAQFENLILKVSKDYPVQQVLLCVDSHNFRKDIYPDYKGTREDNKEITMLKEQVVLRLLENKDWNVVRHLGLEADDLLYLIGKKYDRTVIVSNDNDCKLMLRKDVVFYKYRDEQFIEFDEEVVKKEKYHKTLFGDAGDSVPRLAPKGKGDKSFNALFKKYKHLKQSEFYDMVCEEWGIDMSGIVLNMYLCNYNTVVYKKYVSNFEEIYEQL